MGTRPLEGGSEREAKRPHKDEDTLARMLVQGVVRVLQNRQKDGKGPLLVVNLEEEFKSLWKVPFNLQQAGEKDAAGFLQKWPHKVEVVKVGNQFSVQLPKKGSEKAKAGTSQKTIAPAPLADGASEPTQASPTIPNTTTPKTVSGTAGYLTGKLTQSGLPGAMTTLGSVTAQVASTASQAIATPAPVGSHATIPASMGGLPTPAMLETSKSPGASTAVNMGWGNAQIPAAHSASQAHDGGDPGAVIAPVKVTTGGSFSLSEIRQEANTMLQTMMGIVQQQQAFIASLDRITMDST